MCVFIEFCLVRMVPSKPRLSCCAFIITIVICMVAGECPQNAEHEIRLCIKSSLPNFGLGPPTGISQPKAIREGIDMMRESCQSSKLVDAATCIENILDECRGITDQEQMLQRLFDKDKLMATVKYFCNNLGVYETHTSCIAKQHSMVEECSKDEWNSYMMKVAADAPMDVLILSSCSFMEEASVCLTNMVSLKCGLEAAAFTERILIGMRPPVCGNKTPKYYIPDDDSGAQKISPLSCVLLTFSLLVVSWFRQIDL